MKDHKQVSVYLTDGYDFEGTFESIRADLYSWDIATQDMLDRRITVDQYSVNCIGWIPMTEAEIKAQNRKSESARLAARTRKAKKEQQEKETLIKLANKYPGVVR